MTASSSVSRQRTHHSIQKNRARFSISSIRLEFMLWMKLKAPQHGAIAVAALLLLAGMTSCRQSMANEPRYRTYQESEFFPDGSSARPLPEGTVSQERELDPRLVTGTVNQQPAETFPFPVTLAVLQRGQQRFDIFCTPCHDHLGTGQGMAARRGFRELLRRSTTIGFLTRLPDTFLR